jgi:hypothetical protein
MLALWVILGPGALAWDYKEHRLINTLALSILPSDFPVSGPAARERIAFLAGEPDRWRNTPDFPLRHANNPDHFFDTEFLKDLKLETNQLSPFRYLFVKQWVEAIAKNREVLDLDPAGEKDKDRTKWLMGFLPWSISEQYSRLKSSFSYLKAFEQFGNTEERANALENIQYTMGILGHFVGDAAEPLHTTRNFNGWVDANPDGFTSNHAFHVWIDGGFFAQHPPSQERLLKNLRPAALVAATSGSRVRTDRFEEALQFVLRQHAQVRPLYQLEKDGKLRRGKRKSPEGQQFLEGQLTQAAQFLADLWYTAWKEAPADKYLIGRLREQAETPSASGGE